MKIEAGALARIEVSGAPGITREVAAVRIGGDVGEGAAQRVHVRGLGGKSGVRSEGFVVEECVLGNGLITHPGGHCGRCGHPAYLER